MEKTMIWEAWRGLIRHCGYAALVLGCLLILIGRYLPGFAEPDLHPYILTLVGLLAAGIAGGNIQEGPTRRWVTSVLVGLSVYLAMLVWLLPLSRSEYVLAGGVLVLLIAFCATVVYAKRV